MAAWLQNSNTEPQLVRIQNISGIRSNENNFGQVDFKICRNKRPAIISTFRETYNLILDVMTFLIGQEFFMLFPINTIFSLTVTSHGLKSVFKDFTPYF